MKPFVPLFALWAFWPNFLFTQDTKGQSIERYVQSNDTSLSIEERVQNAHACLKLLNITERDTLYYKINSRLSSLKRSMNQPDSAVFYAKNIIKYGNLHKDNYVRAFGFHKLGFINEKLGHPIEALKNYEDGLKFALQGNEILRAAQLYRAKSDVLNYIGDFNQAEKEAISGLKLLQIENQIHIREIYKLYLSLSNSFQNNKNHLESIRYLDKANAISHSPMEKQKTLNNKGNNLRKLKRYNEAISIYNEALNLNNTSHFTTRNKSKARLLDNLGFTHFKNGQYAIGYEYMQQAFTERNRLGDAEGLHASNIHLLDYYMIMKPEKARTFVMETYLHSKKIKSPDAQLEALNYAIRILPNTQLTNTYLKLRDSLETKKLQLQNTYVRSKFLLDEKEKDLLLAKNKSIEQELLIAEKNRNTIILFGAFILTAAALGVYFYFYNRNKKQTHLIASLHKELHHRVLNNFAIIDTFIGVTLDDTTDAVVRNKLSELQNRIQSISEVHEQLYRNDEIKLVPLHPYVRRVLQNVQESYGMYSVQFDLDGFGKIHLPSKLTFPLGIIINEFVTNSYKYAFTENGIGKIELRFRESEKTYSLMIKDNGPGFPANFDSKTTSSFGIRIIELLSKQLESNYVWSSKDGLQFTITFNK